MCHPPTRVCAGGPYLSEPVRLLLVPLGSTGVQSAGLALVEHERELLERESARDRDMLVLGQLAVDRPLERAELALHKAVAKVIVNARLAAAPDATYLRGSEGCVTDLCEICEVGST